ncbi:MAG: YaiO family outer membrane beta-barrel protein [Bacteroidales bacterium]|nr:YaiO family outer membrane beta-barrel protein [Bacteroidales bacterium]
MRAHLFKLFGFIFFVLSGLFVIPVSAQIKSAGDTTSLETLLNKARQLAYNNGRAEARKICFQILKRDSTYWDAAVLLGRTYSWDSKYDSSRIALNKVIVKKPGYYDAMEALIDNELSDDKYLSAIKYADEGLLYLPDNEMLLFKKARALNKSGKTKESTALLSRILQLNSSNKEAAKLLLDIKRAGRVNKFTMSYSTDIFNGSTPWNFASASIGRKTAHFGSVILRYNFANRFGNNGHQAEIDAYPAICKGIYVYFNAGVSNKKNFPFSRLSIEPYFKLPKSFEASIGIRYMNFDANRIFALDSNKVIIYTGTIGKYFGSYWISVRPYFTKGTDAWSKSASLTVRRYFGDEDSYISLNLGTGMSPDEQQYAFNPDLKFLKSNKISLDYQQKIAYRFIINCGAGYAQEEVRTGVKRSRYSLGVSVSVLF